MNRRNIVGLSAAALLGLALLPSHAIAQAKSVKEQLLGVWSIVSWEQTRTDGTKYQAFGINPKGVNTFDANGNFTLILVRPDLPKLASNNRANPTPEEAVAIVKGAIAYFGTYTVDEKDKIINLRLGGTTFANQVGLVQKRLITSINADEMRYRNPTATSGGQIELVWKRIK